MLSHIDIDCKSLYFFFGVLYRSPATESGPHDITVARTVSEVAVSSMRSRPKIHDYYVSSKLEQSKCRSFIEQFGCVCHLSLPGERTSQAYAVLFRDSMNAHSLNCKIKLNDSYEEVYVH